MTNEFIKNELSGYMELYKGAANGSNVCWSAPAESDLQKWTLTEL